VSSGLEEAKADAVGMFGLAWLGGAWRAAQKPARGILRLLRGGFLPRAALRDGEAHGRAEMMEFNYLLEQRALALADGRYAIDYARMPVALAQLAKELLETEATGDRARAEAWFARYDKMPAELKNALAAAATSRSTFDPFSLSRINDGSAMQIRKPQFPCSG